jgi:N-acetylmuramoyl-L-alanine amidase
MLRETGAAALEFHHPDPSHQAAEANAAGVDCYLSLVLVPDREHCSTAYYRGFQYESLASRGLAELVQAKLPAALGLRDDGITGTSLPILRETRMPAVEVQLGAPNQVVQHIGGLAQVLCGALSDWIDAHSD